jgi:hypothetical protein
MKPKLNQIDFKFFPIGVILLYVPFHLLEEAYFNFPLWMFKHYQLPQQLSYLHWLFNNLIFLIVILLGLRIFLNNKTKYLFFGLGILFWGLMNGMEHIVFSVIDRKIVPGTFTGLFFLIIFIVGILKLFQLREIKLRLLIKSLLIAISYWVISFLIIILIGNYLVKVFPFK